MSELRGGMARGEGNPLVSTEGTREPLSVRYEGEVQVIEWDERSLTRSWPLPCNNCGYTTADYWEKRTWFYPAWSDDPEMSWHLCSKKCVVEWAEREAV